MKFTLRLVFHLTLITLLVSSLSACVSKNAHQIKSEQKANRQKQSETSTIEKETTETLIAQAPADWQLIFELNNGDTRLSDFIPSNESEDNWHTKLSFESHAQLADIDPIAIMMGEISKKSEICTNIDHSNLFSGLENNYPTSVRLILCGENAHTSLGEVSLTKGIQGEDYFYIVRIEKKVPSFKKGEPEFPKKEIAEWSSYLKRIILCDSNASKGHACPSGKSVH